VKNFPYVNNYAQRILDPEYGISYIKYVLSFQVIYSLLKVGFGLILMLIDFTYWCNSISSTAK
jgi:hypothetical protein